MRATRRLSCVSVGFAHEYGITFLIKKGKKKKRNLVISSWECSFAVMLSLKTLPAFVCMVSVPCFSATIEASFSPGQAEANVVAVIGEAKSSVRMAAYSFTSKPIAEALVKAKRRGVAVSAVLDKSQKTERYSGAIFLLNEGISVRINSRYAIMHNKFLVIDDATVETGSFNFTGNAAKKNAENVLIIRGDKALAATFGAEWERLWKESDEYRREE